MRPIRPGFLSRSNASTRQPSRSSARQRWAAWAWCASSNSATTRMEGPLIGPLPWGDINAYIPAVPPNILLVRFSAMGDTLLITPLIRALRTRHPDARISVLTKAEYAPLFQHNPRVNAVLGFQPGDSLRAVGRQIRAEGYTHRLDLHVSLRSRALRWQAGGRWTSYPKHR